MSISITKNYIYNTTQKIILPENLDKTQNSISFFQFIKNIFAPQNEQVISSVSQFLTNEIQTKLSLPNDKVQEVFNRVLRFCKVRNKDLDQVESVRKVLHAIENVDTFGTVPSIYKDQEFVPGESGRNFIKHIFSGTALSSKMINWDFVKSLLFTKNESLLKEIREELQLYMVRLATELNEDKYKNPSDQKQAEVLVGNILALYPFFEPSDGTTLKVPQKINDKWELVNYQLDLIPMTPFWKGDPYYACGLTPLDNKNAVPHLIFMGTPPPTTRGVAHAEFTDFIPGRGVGETLYEEGKNGIENWVESIHTTTKKKVNVYGQSLGGALSLLLIANKPEHVGTVYAYNPPSLFGTAIKRVPKQNQKPARRRKTQGQCLLPRKRSRIFRRSRLGS